MSDPAIPTPAERVQLNATLLVTGAETGFWDDNGRPAHWPDDIDESTPTTDQTQSWPEASLDT